MQPKPEDHIGIVHHTARQLHRVLAARCSLDELLSAGTMGLISACKSFDESRGLEFTTHAVPRIRGAMLDDLRKRDHVPRSVRRKDRKIKIAIAAVAARVGREPLTSEIAEELGVSIKTYELWRAQSEYAVQVSIDGFETDTKNAADGYEVIPDPSNPIDHQVELESECAMMARHMALLSAQEKMVLKSYFFDNMKMWQIAERAGLTEARISQVRARALIKLREMAA